MIAVLTDPGVGGTFLTWTLHYLAGHRQYYNVRKQCWLDVPDTPLNQNNAHGFAANQPLDLDAFIKIKQQLDQVDTPVFHSIYFHHFTGAELARHEDTARAVELLDTCKKVVLTNSPEHALYQLEYRTRGGSYTAWKDHTKLIHNDRAAWMDFIQHFYSESLEQWGENKLDSVWDLREFLALNLKPFDRFGMEDNTDLTNDHYRLNTMELWTVFDQTVPALFDYLEQKLFQPRMENWTKIYKQWQRIHQDRLLFVWYFDTIIKYIIKGYDLDLTRFNLDLIQEASIQHVLIHQHQLNLKTWQLEKFTSTQQLHQLLEPSSYKL